MAAGFTRTLAFANIVCCLNSFLSLADCEESNFLQRKVVIPRLRGADALKQSGVSRSDQRQTSVWKMLIFKRRTKDW